MHQLMRLFTLVALAATIALTSCQQDSGLQTASDGTEFKIQKSTGSPKIQPGQYVYYHAQRRKGEEVESSSREFGDPQIFQVPAESDPNSQTALLEEVLTSMGVGDSTTIYLRLDTLPTKPPGFEEEEVMFFDLVVVDVKDEAEFQAEQAELQAAAEAEAAVVRESATAVIEEAQGVVAQYAAGALSDKVQRTGSGLGYMVVEEGTGSMPTTGRQVSVQYVGMLTDGTVFDNSFERGNPITFPLGVGRVIPGWDEGLALLKEGSKGYLFIPHQLGYGEAGSPPTIPGSAELVFYVELVKAF